MGVQIIQQPDGKYALFSSISDQLIFIRAEEKDVVEWFVKQAAQRAREEVEKTLAQIKAGKQPYCQFTKTWEEAKEQHFSSCKDEKFNEAVSKVKKGGG